MGKLLTPVFWAEAVVAEHANRQRTAGLEPVAEVAWLSIERAQEASSRTQCPCLQDAYRQQVTSRLSLSLRSTHPATSKSARHTALSFKLIVTRIAAQPSELLRHLEQRAARRIEQLIVARIEGVRVAQGRLERVAC